MVLTGGYEIGALITLLLLVAVYEASDYVDRVRRLELASRARWPGSSSWPS